MEDMLPKSPDPHTLWLAAGRGLLDMCTDLLERNHNVPGYIDYIDSFRETSTLVHALKNAHYDRFTGFSNPPETGKYLSVIKLLLAYGAKIENDARPADALYYAIEQGPSIEYMQVLLNSPQNINLDRKFRGRTPLMTALSMVCNSGRLAREQMLRLLSHGADVHVLDDKGNDILHQIGSDDERVCNILAKFGADFNRKCRYGRTPLHYAIYTKTQNMQYGNFYANGFVKAMQVFLDHGTDVYARDDTGRTAIQLAEALLPPNDRGLELLQSIDLMTTFAMGTHEKNGEECLMKHLPKEVIRLILRPEHQQ